MRSKKLLTARILLKSKKILVIISVTKRIKAVTNKYWYNLLVIDKTLFLEK